MLLENLQVPVLLQQNTGEGDFLQNVFVGDAAQGQGVDPCLLYTSDAADE